MTFAAHDRLVVASPHLDDAVFSLGATIAKAAALGAHVRVVTVLANDPTAATPAHPWERACGFRSAGEAAQVRRAEDSRACRIVGASPVWLPFGDREHGRGADDATIMAALAEHLGWATALLVPGYPLGHSDHAWLAGLLLNADLPAHVRVGLYVEQPYAANAAVRRLMEGTRVGLRREPAVALAVAPWRRVTRSRAEWRRKHLAIGQYDSQLRHPYLRLARTRITLYELLRGGERVAWLPPSARPASSAAGSIWASETAIAPRRDVRLSPRASVAPTSRRRA